MGQTAGFAAGSWIVRQPPRQPIIKSVSWHHRAVIAVLLLPLIKLLFLYPAFADQLGIDTKEPIEPAEQNDAATVSELKVPGFSGVNVTHSYLSTTVEKLSQSIDRFFGEERIYEETTGTYIQARGSYIYSRGGEFDFDGKFRAKLDLPQLKEKINLVIESDDSGDDREDFNRITTGDSFTDEVDDSGVSAALQFMLREKERWSLSIRPGLKFSSAITTFIKLRFRRIEPLGKTWLSRETVEVAYFSDRGLESELKLDLERDIGNKNFFRSTSTFLWREDIPGNQFLGQTFLVTHYIDQRQSLAFEIGTGAETRPNLRDLSYFGSIRYRRDIHRGWLFLEVKPQVIYTRENNFKADPAFVLSLEALLGAKYLD